MAGPLLFASFVVVLSVLFAPSQAPRMALNGAADVGNVRAVQRLVTEAPFEKIDLDSALAYAAGGSHTPVMTLLVKVGASDLDRALVQAAMRNQVMACRWLISEERHKPARNFDAALVAAAATGADDAEWFLLSKQRQAQRKNAGRCFDARKKRNTGKIRNMSL